ncbi:MAG TPA: TetR/AcrR family transcriptional regulator [Planktothrix sp.]|jgi:AcrR family transcriptional regulator
MARPKSEEKRARLLSAATEVFAKNGLTASTASITSAAGMAEGTLFIYFKGKDELINELYAELKQELGEAMLRDYPGKESIQSRFKHVWDRLIDWGMENPDKLSTVHKIKVYEGLRPEVRDSLHAKFGEVHALWQTAQKEGIFQDVPHEFVMAVLSAQAETAIVFMKQDPKGAATYKEKGFEMFWSGITRKK